MNIPKLSFCITCMNRLNQIKETLPQNLRDNILFNEKIEFIVVDFATPGLQQWIKSEFEEELRSGYLKYYYTEELRYWHASIAKNTAHLLANNDILVNLDCDNYTGYNGGWFVICQFLKYGMNLVLHQESGDPFDGSFGRISICKKWFTAIGGYDENFEPTGYQDVDLMNRLKISGCHYIVMKDAEYNKAIYNTKEENILYTNSLYNTWKEMDRHNYNLSQENIKNGHIIANNGLLAIRKNIFDSNNKQVFSIGQIKNKISFNITCMNRRHHLEQTLVQNIEKNSIPGRVEFVLLDYNSTDGLEEWVKELQYYIDTGILVYYRTEEPLNYHRTHSRNMAFRLSTGDIVCNLDADNFLGEGFASYILDIFNQGDETFFCTPQYSERDVIGRICVRRKHFFTVNGYDETLSGYGLEDIDLYNRLEKVGLQQRLLPIGKYYSAIHHSHEERISHEYMGMHVEKIYLSYLNPYTTEVLLMYKNGKCNKALSRDNPHFYRNQTIQYNSQNEYILNSKNRIQRENDWVEIQWASLSEKASFYEVKSKELWSTVLLFLSESQNCVEINERDNKRRVVNQDGYGRGIVYKNLNNETLIELK